MMRSRERWVFRTQCGMWGVRKEMVKIKRGRRKGPSSSRELKETPCASGMEIEGRVRCFLFVV